MRIGVLTSAHPPFDSRIFRKECRSLARGGHDVTLIVPHDRDESIDGVRLRALPRPRSRAERMLRIPALILKEALRLDADVYHFHDPELIPVGLTLRARGKKVVYDVHEDLPRDILEKEYLPTWARPPLSTASEALEDLAARCFSALVPATPAIADRFRSRGARRVTPVQNFPFLEELSPPADLPWSARPFAATYVGVITANRGIGEMVRAMGELSAALDARLVIAGEMSPAALHPEVERLPGWDRVRYVGYCDRARVAAILAEVRMGLVVLHPSAAFRVSYPTKMFEYMSAGLPVIASDFPLWREIVLDLAVGLVVDPLDPSAIARAITRLLTHPDEAEEMGRRGREAVERIYNWQREEEKLLALYASLGS